MRAGVAWAVVLFGALSSCRSVPIAMPRAGLSAVERGVVVVTVVADPSLVVHQRPDTIWAVTTGAPDVREWSIEVARTLDVESAEVAEAVVVHELWHVLTDNVKPHGARGTVSAGSVGVAHHPTEPVASDVAATTGRSFDVEAPGAPPWLARALRASVATWNRVLGREALRLVAP